MPLLKKLQTYSVLIPTLLLTTQSVIAQEITHEESCQSLYKLAVDKYHNEEFDAALEIAKKIRDQYPEEPAGIFALLGTYQSMMVNYRVRLYETAFDSLLDPAVDISKAAIKKDKRNGLNYFYLGCAYGFRSTFNANKKEWLAAFRDGMQISSNYKKALKYSPDFYDSYYGLGLYNYWIGVKAKILRFLPFARNSRKEGLQQIKIAVEKAEFLNVDAMYGLNMAYFNEGKYEEALELSQKLIKTYPNNPTLHYRIGRLSQKLDKWGEAKTAFSGLYKLLKHAKNQSLSYQVECLFQTAKCEYNLENYTESRRLSQEALALEKQCDFEKELDGPMEKYSKILDQLHELSDDIKDITLTESGSK